MTAIRQQFQAEEASSATGFQMPVIETPVSVSVFTEDMIEVTGARTIEEYANYVPNVDKYQDFGGSSAKYQSRGFRIDALRGLKINGVSFYNTQIDSYFTEQVEFVRGPTSIVYGNNGFGGIINTITKRPERDPAVTVGLETASWDRYRGDLDVNVPLGERFAARLITGYEEGGQYLRGLDRELHFIAPSISVDLSDRTRLLLTGALQRRESTPSDQYTAITDDDGNLFLDDNLSRRNFIGADWAVQENELDIAQAQLTHGLTERTSLKLSYGFSSAQFDTDYAYAYGPAASNGDASVYAFRAREGVDLHVVEASVGGEFDAFGRTHEFLVAAEYYDQEVAIDDFSSFSIGTINLYDPQTDFARPDFGDPTALNRRNQKNYALSAQALLRPADRLSLLLGARYDDGNTEDNSDFTDPAQRDNRYDSLTLRAGASFEIVDDFNVYASFSEGFQPVSSAARTIGNEVPDPEEGIQYEAGLKGKLFGGGTTFTLAWFEITRENILEGVRGSPDLVQITGEQEHSGIEFEVVGELFKGLNLIASYAYLDTEITQNTEAPELVGNEQGNVPRNSASAYVSYAPQGGLLTGFAFGVGVRYEGERWVSTDNDLRLPGYTVADVSVLYRWNQKLSARLTVNNIFDEYYWDPYYDRTAYGLAHGAPREVAARISYKF